MPIVNFFPCKKNATACEFSHSSCLDGRRTSCLRTLLQISDDVLFWCPTKIEVPLWFCKNTEIVLATKSSQSKLVRQSQKGGREEKWFVQGHGVGQGQHQQENRTQTSNTSALNINRGIYQCNYSWVRMLMGRYAGVTLAGEDAGAVPLVNFPRRMSPCSWA